MPNNRKRIEEHIQRLLEEAPQGTDDLTALPGFVMAWLISAQHAVQLVCPSSTNAYHVHANRIVTDALFAASRVSQMCALLLRLWAEIEGGLLTTFENRVIAATFDDFLDHGAEYLKGGRKDEAAVIAGIVFEDTIRRISRILEIDEKGVALETLITELAKRGILTGLKAKRGRAAAGLRTSAAHARWGEIQLSDVKPVIEFTRELMAAHLE